MIAHGDGLPDIVWLSKPTGGRQHIGCVWVAQGGYPPRAPADPYPKLHISPQNPLYPATIATVLDVLLAVQWEAPAAASLLGLSTSALVRFLRDDGHLWAAVKHQRAELGMSPLRER